MSITPWVTWPALTKFGTIGIVVIGAMGSGVGWIGLGPIGMGIGSISIGAIGASGPRESETR